VRKNLNHAFQIASFNFYTMLRFVCAIKFRYVRMPGCSFVSGGYFKVHLLHMCMYYVCLYAPHNFVEFPNKRPKLMQIIGFWRA